MTPPNTPKFDRRAVVSWCLYDWANSAFTTLVVTFVYATYFTQTFAVDENVGTQLWSRGIVISSLLIAIASPILGAIADRGGSRRRFLITSTFICIAATSALTFISPTQDSAVVIALGVFIIANVAFEIGMVFYNSFLPTLAPPKLIGRISGYGWGLGYAGGLMALVFGLFGLVGLGGGEPLIRLSTEDGFNIRATNLLVALWFLVFSVPTLLFVRDPARPVTRVKITDALKDVAETFRKIQKYREVVKFLIARLVYNDGLITIFAFGGIYAAGTFGMTFQEVIIFAIVINLGAGLGALLFGIVDDKLGGKTTVLFSIVALAASSLLAVVAPSRAVFWIAGIGIGIFAGPNQAASRSLMGRFVPQRHQAEFFGFFAFSGKATAFLGPLLLGTLTASFGQRVGVSSVLLFFAVGGVLLMLVNEREGIAAAEQPSGS